MSVSYSNRALSTPSSYAREHYLYVQEAGNLISLSPHLSSRKNLDSYLFFIVTDGMGYVTYEGKTWDVTPGTCVWLDCSKPYSHISSPDLPWSLMWVHFYGVQATDFYKDFLSKGYPFLFRPANTFSFKNTLTQLYREQTRKDSLTEINTHKYLTDLITLIFTENSMSLSRKKTIPDKFLLIKKYLEEHFAQKVYLDNLSEQFFISKFHLSREYRKYFGISIQEELNQLRIAHAKSLLRFSEHSLEEIATQCGFQNSGYFIKVFQKNEHITPAQYRKKW